MAIQDAGGPAISDVYEKADFINISAGVADAGKPIVLDSSGLISGTMLDSSDIDHGSLGGLADDDHTQYALLAGRSGGQTLLGGIDANDDLNICSTSHATKGDVKVSDCDLVIGKNVYMTSTASDTEGVVFKNGNHFIHDYAPSLSAGFNLFIGEGSGNFSMSASSSYQCSENTGYGRWTLRALSSGYANTAVGPLCGSNLTSGYQNALIGSGAGRRLTTGYRNVFIGHVCAGSTDVGKRNIAIGSQCMTDNADGNGNVAFGYLSLQNNVSDDNNISIGYRAMNTKVGGSGNVVIGADGFYSATTTAYSVGIGYRAGYSELTSNKLYISNSNTSVPIIYGDFSTNELGFGTNSPQTRLEIETPSDWGKEAFAIDQQDADEAFIDYVGTSNTDTSSNISTQNGDGSVEGPKNYSTQNGWQFEGMVKIEVNGTAYWMPYYSPDTA